jgi:hypothetical protein
MALFWMHFPLCFLVLSILLIHTINLAFTRLTLCTVLTTQFRVQITLDGNIIKSWLEVVSLLAWHCQAARLRAILIGTGARAEDPMEMLLTSVVLLDVEFTQDCVYC